ncbi:MAG TPA: threonylcarbamoyl-AMP synthase [Candidatus Aenigmarchaeota archaeon]|nr:threonylcarbamoyl-AMP synthase [Candidatus Aenigmarchaeota archaeon]
MNQIEKAVEILKIGGIVAYPTETVYGLGSDIFNEQAIRRVFEVKLRSLNKPLSIAISNFSMLERLAYLLKEQRKIIRKLLPGPITIILPKKDIVSDLITSNQEKVAIRFPENNIAQKLIEKTGPITATSANFSGEKEVVKPEDITLNVDFIIYGECKYKQPSTILDLTNMRILREGAGIEKVKEVLNF